MLSLVKKCVGLFSALHCAIVMFVLMCAPRVSAQEIFKDISHQQEIFPYIAVIVSDNVNVRAGQNKNFETLCQLNRGDEVVVVERNYSWYKIKLPRNALSFISADFVQPLKYGVGEVTGNRVNVRAGAFGTRSVIGKVKKGDYVTIIEKLEDWYKIVPVEGSYGWIKEDFLSYKSNLVDDYTENLVSVALKGTEEIARESLVLTQEDKEEIVSASGLEIDTVSVKTSDTVVLKGVLRPQRAIGGSPGFRLELGSAAVDQEESTYYLSAPEYVLNDFLHYDVTIEGDIDLSERSQYSHPVINISKIQLVL